MSDLIVALEGQFQAGVDLYHRGQLDEARRQFDLTLQHLLGSSFEVRATPRLQAELESLRDRIGALESDSLASGGFNQAQATPLARIPELTFPLDATTRAAVEREARTALASAGRNARALELPLNEAVLRYVDYFTTRGKPDLLLGFRRAGRYRALAEAAFAAADVPMDLFYMAQLESAFLPREGKARGALGMWQFEPARAADYGLKRTAWVDQRMDPAKSTVAAAKHLHDLYQQFGNWLLAMAAYNAGPGRVQRAVAQTGYADFWKLSEAGALPKVVRSYVPIVLAIALIARDPQEYGLDPVEPEAPLAVDVVKLAVATDLRLAADCAGVTLEDLRRLNPSLLHMRAPQGYDLKLPQGSQDTFQEALAVVPPSERLQWRLVRVRAGETLGALSRRTGVSKARLAKANHLKEDAQLREGRAMAVPSRTLRTAPKRRPGAEKGQKK